MKNVIVILLILFLSGCATVYETPQEPSPQATVQLTDAELLGVMTIVPAILGYIGFTAVQLVNSF